MNAKRAVFLVMAAFVLVGVVVVKIVEYLKPIILERLEQHPMKKRDKLDELFEKLPPEDQWELIEMAWQHLLPPGSAAELNAKLLAGATLMIVLIIIFQALGMLYAPFEFYVIVGTVDCCLLLLTLACIRHHL